MASLGHKELGLAQWSYCNVWLTSRCDELINNGTCVDVRWYITRLLKPTQLRYLNMNVLSSGWHSGVTIVCEPAVCVKITRMASLRFALCLLSHTYQSVIYIDIDANIQLLKLLMLLKWKKQWLIYDEMANIVPFLLRFCNLLCLY